MDKQEKQSIDPVTGLNLFDDERLIRAREAMILAVQLFNSAVFRFKTEVFSVLVNIAWTYLLHEFYERKKVNMVQKDGRSLLLSQMVERSDCPLSDGAKNNLRSLKTIRDEVEHKLLGKSDVKWLGLFQACCLNFDEAMCKLFGEQLTLAHELSVALQFGRMNVEQLSLLHKYDIPPHIEAVDARLNEKLSENELADLEYQFRVVYTMDSASKAVRISNLFDQALKKAKRYGTSWSSTKSPTTSIHISRVRSFVLRSGNLARLLRLTITRRPGGCSRSAHVRGQISPKTPKRSSVSITPPMVTILTRTSGSSIWLVR